MPTDSQRCRISETRPPPRGCSAGAAMSSGTTCSPWGASSGSGRHRGWAGANPIRSPCSCSPSLALAQQEQQGTRLGGDLLLDALIRSVAGARQYGARALVVDAINDRAVEFYCHHGFLPLEGRRIYRRISDIERALRG